MTTNGPTRSTGYFGALSATQYMLLTTYRRDGSPVGTAVNVAVEGGYAYFRTWDVSGKAKRLRRTPSVTVAASGARGRPRGPTISAQAVLLEGEASERAARLLAREHPLLHGHLIPWYHRRRGWTTQQYRLEAP
jgi:uncharacterized protein